MAKAGDTIESPAIGDRIVFLKTARDTDGKMLQFDDFLNVGGNGPVERRSKSGCRARQLDAPFPSVG